MKIKDIEVFLLSDQLDEAFYFSQFSYSSRLICIVKVTTESGLVAVSYTHLHVTSSSP